MCVVSMTRECNSRRGDTAPLVYAREHFNSLKDEPNVKEALARESRRLYIDFIKNLMIDKKAQAAKGPTESSKENLVVRSKFPESHSMPPGVS